MKCDAKNASSDAIRRSQANASASPPPTAPPLTAAMTGWGASRIASISFARCSCDFWTSPTGPRPAVSGAGAPEKLMSAPAQKV